MFAKSMFAKSMFAESLLESGNIHPKGRGWATTLSIAIQALLVATLVALPMFRPDTLPTQIKSIHSPVAFGSPDVPPDPQRGPSQSNSNNSELFTPPTIPAGPVMNQGPREEAPASCIPFCGTASTGQKNGIPGMFNIPIPLNPTTVSVKPPERVVVSEFKLGSVITRVQPIYPHMAVVTRTEGSVVLRALIDREGRIASVQVLSGPALLQRAARDAVLQWRYRPYVLNGQPVEVETQITVRFILNR